MGEGGGEDTVLYAANKRTFSLEICECNLSASLPRAHTHR